MKPRLKNSVKKTDFPADYVKMVRDVVTKNFKKHIKDMKVVVEGAIYLEEVTMRVGFLEKGAIRQANFEASVGHSPKAKDVMTQIYLAIDALGAMIGQYFEAEGDIELPKTWTEFKMDGKSVYLQFSTENSELEAAANALLHDEED